VLWDAKFRGAAVVLQQSKTFVNTATRAACLKQAAQYIENNRVLSAAQKAEATQSIENGTYRLITVGQGNATAPGNSLFQ
jgi:hypothetical protein